VLPSLANKRIYRSSNAARCYTVMDGIPVTIPIGVINEIG